MKYVVSENVRNMDESVKLDMRDIFDDILNRLKAAELMADHINDGNDPEDIRSFMFAQKALFRDIAKIVKETEYRLQYGFDLLEDTEDYELYPSSPGVTKVS